jgi:hypothetical protein
VQPSFENTNNAHQEQSDHGIISQSSMDMTNNAHQEQSDHGIISQSSMDMTIHSNDVTFINEDNNSSDGPVVNEDSMNE